MGLIKAAAGAVLGTLADQWKEYFSCDVLGLDVLMVKGLKNISSRSSNRYGSDNVITEGSGIVVADGQCVLIVCQGVVTEVIAEPGLYTFKSHAEPSIFSGELNESLLRDILKTMWHRFEFGGYEGQDQRVYYVNLKEIVGNKFGTATPIPFRVIDRNIGLDIDVSVRCNGVYSFKITDPISFYVNVCGNVAVQFDADTLATQLKSEFLSALQPGFAGLSEKGVRPSAIPAHVNDLCAYMDKELSPKWSKLRGISIVSVAINSVTLPDEDAKLIRDLQSGAIMRDPTMAAAQLTASQAAAMRAAASNPNGAVSGFMGMGMASMAGGVQANELFKMGQNTPPANPQVAPQTATQNGATTSSSSTWTCSCGSVNTGKFCTQCGSKKPEDGWRCECGTLNRGNFCTECGRHRPKDSPLYVCDKCGYVPPDPKNPPKFCPQCGDRFDENDIQK